MVLAAAAVKSLQSCPTVRPHRRQPTRLLHPWDSPGKSTEVGCQCLLQYGTREYYNCILLSIHVAVTIPICIGNYIIGTKKKHLVGVAC